MKLSKRSQNIVLIAMILAVSMTTIDQTIVALAANTIQSGLGVSHAVVTWSINAYILATAAFFLLGGKLADVFGHRKMVLIGISTFAFFSLLCSLTPTGSFAGAWLIIARALQGVSTAIMFPAALGIVRNSFPASGQGKAAATFFSITGAMTAIGPIAGGVLINWTWRAIFWINLPIAAIALLLLVGRMVTTPSKRVKIDLKGAVVAALGMSAIVGGLQQAGTWGWGSIGTWALIVVGAILLVIFVLMEQRLASPLVKISLFKERGFRLSSLAMFFSSFAFVPIFFFISVYAQVSLGLSVGNTGILLLEFFIGYLIGARVGGRIYDKTGAKHPILFGGVLGAVGFAWWASKLNMLNNGGGFLNSPQFWPIVIAGAGIGIMFSVASTDIADRSKSESYGEAAGVSQTAKNLGGAFGLALLSAILAVHLTSTLTSSFAKIGIPASVAKSVSQDINSGTKSSGKNNQLSHLSKKSQKQVSSSIASSYATASKPVFYGMAGSLAVVAIIGIMYPEGDSKRANKLTL
jgi:EmrB/QacA subfamily drug resistance transporter